MTKTFVDMAEIEAVLERAGAAMLPRTLLPGSVGAQARMSLAAHHAFSRQLAMEVNLGTDAEHISDALAAVCSNMISDFVGTLLGSDQIDARHEPMMCRQLEKTATFLSQRVAGTAENISSDAVVARECGGEA